MPCDELVPCDMPPPIPVRPLVIPGAPWNVVLPPSKRVLAACEIDIPSCAVTIPRDSASICNGMTCEEKLAPVVGLNRGAP
jgi:hypothetical protein